MQHKTGALQCRICWFINEPDRENCVQCGAVLPVRPKPAPVRNHYAPIVEKPTARKSHTLLILACVVVAVGGLVFLVHGIVNLKNSPVMTRTAKGKQIFVEEKQEASPAVEANPLATAEEIGTRPLNTEKEKEEIIELLRKYGDGQGCRGGYTLNSDGEEVPMRQSPGQELTVHDVQTRVFYQKVSAFALAEANFDIERSCGAGGRAVVKVSRQYVWKTLGSGVYHWEFQPDGFDRQISALVRKEQGSGGNEPAQNQPPNPQTEEIKRLQSEEFERYR